MLDLSHIPPRPHGLALSPPDAPEHGGGAGERGKLLPLRPAGQHEARVIAVTSGKGGVGKSVISANLGICLARTGRKVLLVDADLGLANLDLMLGVKARASVREVLSGGTTVSSAMVEGPSGVMLLPACSGDVKLAELDETARLGLLGAIDSLEDRFDTVVVDTGAGIGSNALYFAAAAQQILVVTTPDPAAMADAYAMIKVLHLRCGVERIHLAVNMASGPREAEQVVSRMLGLVHQFLDVALVPVGFIYRDEAVLRSVKECVPLVAGYPQAPISGSLHALAERLIDERPDAGSRGTPQLFWKKVIGLHREEDDR